MEDQTVHRTHSTLLSRVVTTTTSTDTHHRDSQEDLQVQVRDTLLTEDRLSRADQEDLQVNSDNSQVQILTRAVDQEAICREVTQILPEVEARTQPILMPTRVRDTPIARTPEVEAQLQADHQEDLTLLRTTEDQVSLLTDLQVTTTSSGISTRVETRATLLRDLHQDTHLREDTHRIHTPTLREDHQFQDQTDRWVDQEFPTTTTPRTPTRT